MFHGPGISGYLPNPTIAFVTGREKGVIVQKNSAPQTGWMGQRRADRLSGLGIPETGSLIAADGQHPGATLAETGVVDLVLMLQLFGLAIFGTLPDERRGVLTRCHHAVALRTECGRKDAVAMVQRPPQRCPIEHIPNLRRTLCQSSV